MRGISPKIMVTSEPSDFNSNHIKVRDNEVKSKELDFDIKKIFEVIANELKGLTLINLESGTFQPDKDALAFLVNDIWEKDKGLTCVEELEKLCNEIKSLKEGKTNQEASVEVSWLINRKVDAAYQKCLETRIKEDEKNATERKKTEGLLKLKKSFDPLSPQIHRKKMRVTLGGVDHTCLPLWYLQNYIKKEALVNELRKTT